MTQSTDTEPANDDGSPRARLDGFIDRYAPEVAAAAREVLARMRARLPGATALVYDSYNALAVSFGAGERASDAVFSVAVYPRHVSFFFLQGAALPDPRGRLRGEGSRIRHVVLSSPADLDDPAIQALIEAALERRPIPTTGEGRLIIKSVSAKQRPRRPA